MSDFLKNLQTQREDARSGVSSQAATQRSEVERQYQEAESGLRRQASDVEREAEAAKGRARQREALEQRKRDLPITKPVDTGAKEVVAEVSKTQAEAHAKVREGHKEVGELKEANLTAITEAEQKALAEIEQQYQMAMEELQEFEAANVELKTGEWVSRDMFEGLTADARAQLSKLGVDAYNDWATKQVEIMSSLPTQDIGGQSYYNLEAIAASTELSKIFTDNVDGGQQMLTDYKAMASLPTIEVEGNTYYDLAKIAGNRQLETTFASYVEGGQQILTDYKAQTSLPTTTVYNPEAQAAIDAATKAHGRATIPESVKSGEIPAKITVYDLDKIAANTSLTTAFIAFVPDGQQILANFNEAQTIMAKLDDYKTEGGYNISAFLRDNPKFVTDKLVAVAGFDAKDVNSAVEYNQQPWVVKTIGEEYAEVAQQAGFDALKLALFIENPNLLEDTQGWVDYKKSHPTVAAKIESLLKASYATADTISEPTLSLVAFKDAFIEARGYETENEKELLSALATSEYQRLYGRGTYAVSMGTALTTYVFSPARVLYPEVELKDISALEWAVGGAQLALFAIPVVGLSSSVAAKAIITGVEVAAGATFAAATAIQWADMSWTERGISLAMTVAILMPVGIRGVKSAVGRVGEEVSYIKLQRAGINLSKDWRMLDRVELKYGRASSQYVSAEAKVVKAQTALKSAIGETTISASSRVDLSLRQLQSAVDSGNRVAIKQARLVVTKTIKATVKVAKAEAKVSKITELKIKIKARAVNRSAVKLQDAIKSGDSAKIAKAQKALVKAETALKTVVGKIVRTTAKEIRTAITLARDMKAKVRAMNRATGRLQSALKSGNAIKIAKASSAAQQAIGQAKKASEHFTNFFTRLESLTAKQLKVLEKKSGIAGLQQAVMGVSKAQNSLNKLWAAAEKIKVKYGIDSPQYMKVITNVAKAQSRLESAFESFAGKIEVSGATQAKGAMGWDSLIKQTEGDISAIRAELNKLQQLLKKPRLYRARNISTKTIKRYMGELKTQLSLSRTKLGEYVANRDAKVKILTLQEKKIERGKAYEEQAREQSRRQWVAEQEAGRRGIYAEQGWGGGGGQTVQRTTVKIKPPDPDLQKLLDEISLKVPPEGKGGVATAVRVKAPWEIEVKKTFVRTEAKEPTPIKTRPEPALESQLPLFKTKAKPKAPPKVETKTPPKVPKVKPEYEPGYQQRIHAKPDVRDYEDAILVAIGTTLSGKPLIGSALEQEIRTDIEPFVKPITKTTPDILRETATILAQAVKEALRLKQQGMTKAQINAAIQSMIKAQLKQATATETTLLTKTQTKTQTKALTKTQSGNPDKDLN